MNGKVSTRRLSLITEACMLLFSCTITAPDQTGNTTQTGNGATIAVTGRFYEPDGRTPAPDARVIIHQLGANDQALSGSDLKKRAITGLETVYTNDEGKFQFSASNGNGPFMIEAERGETLFAMIEYVALTGNDSAAYVEDTLKPPGAIKAVVCFDYPDVRVEKATFELNAYFKSDMNDAWSSNIYFARAYDADWIDSAHNCRGVLAFENLAEGIYTFRAIIKFQNNEKKIVFLKKPMIAVKSRQVTDLDTLRLPEMDIPDVEQCWAGGYDTITGAVHLGWRWNVSDTEKVSGVNIYQVNPPPALPLKLNTIPVRDTVYTDTGFWDFPRRPKINNFWLNPEDTTFDTIAHDKYVIPVQSISVSYFLMSVDKNGNESWKVHSLSPSSIWWKLEDGMPFLPDTLSDTLTYFDN